VVALHPYTGAAEGELTMEKGDEIAVTDEGDNSGWWKGKCARECNVMFLRFKSNDARFIIGEKALDLECSSLAGGKTYSTIAPATLLALSTDRTPVSKCAERRFRFLI
jgi:hypothetical protein